MDWFERLMGFREPSYDDTRKRIEIDGSTLRSRINGRVFAIGKLELVSLGTLRERIAAGKNPGGRLKVRNITGDVRRLHCAVEYAGALFQVASQFNLLEMISPHVRPEDGVTCYQNDPTQGPACAIAAGAATIYRNYFVPVGGQPGQTHERQLDGLADIGDALSRATSLPVDRLWKMTNGYALCSQNGLDAITAYLTDLGDHQVDDLRALLRIGVHQDVEVAEGGETVRPLVSQAFCSALPVAYSDMPAARWRHFAKLVLEAAYEATLWAAVLNARRGASNIVLLTRLGGGAFGNDDDWIDAAMRRALEKVKDYELDVRLVSSRVPSSRMLATEQAFS
jgi:hypothetical protein